MHWNIIKNKNPPSGAECIVARVVNGKRSYGIYTYFYASESFWYSNKTGDKRKVLEYDHWYLVDDIIEYAENRFIDELESAFHEINNLHTFD